MSSDTHHPALVEDDDAIGMEDSLEAMGNDYSGLPLQEVPEDLVDQGFGMAIKG